MKNIIRYIILTFLLFFVFQTVFGQHYSNNNEESERVSIEDEYICPKIDSIIAFAKTKLGCTYKSGGTGPRSFDCSGFMYYVFDHFGIRLGRSSRDQIQMGEVIEKKDVRKGDLVFWYRGKGYVGHAGLVVDVDSAHNFTFIHASTHGKGVRLDRSNGNWYASTYAGARRIIDCDDDGRALFVQVGKPAPKTEPTKKEETLSENVVAQRDTLKFTSPSTTVVPKPQTIYHKIKSGETLSTIAKKYHVSVKQIKQWNHLHSDMIRAGEKLKIYKHSR